MVAGHSRCGGFTLIEVMLALMIMGLVFMGSQAIVSRVITMAQDVDRRQSMEQHVRVCSWVMNADLGSVLYSDGNKTAMATYLVFFGGRNLPKALDAPDDEEIFLSFATAAAMTFTGFFPSHSMVRVEYVLRKDAERQGTFLLIRRETPLPQLPLRTGAARPYMETDLAAGIKDVRLSFQSNRGEWSPDWDNRAKLLAGQWHLPFQVRVTLTLLDKEERSKTLEIVSNLPLRVIPAGVGRTLAQ
uniref:Type II secretion system protein J n=1 Tax=Fundidesulfovibrio putealis TaxID=270496 RepID=A0A7C3W843_9BACT